MASELKWTRGPWKAGRPSRALMWRVTSDAATDDNPIAVVVGRRAPAENVANARLLATAPKLYALLALARKHLEEHNREYKFVTSDETLAAIDNALAEARGELGKHEWKGRQDRPCEICGLPDRDHRVEGGKLVGD